MCWRTTRRPWRRSDDVLPRNTAVSRSFPFLDWRGRSLDGVPPTRAGSPCHEKRVKRVKRESDGIAQAWSEVFCGDGNRDAGGGVRAGVSPVDSGEAAGG